MREFELFFKGKMLGEWCSWGIVREEDLEFYLRRWDDDNHRLEFGKLKCREILAFGDGLYTRERMRDLSAWLQEKS